MKKTTFNLPLIGFIFGLLLQLLLILIDAYATYGELSFNVIKLQQKSTIHLFLDSFPFIFLFISYLLEKKYTTTIDKLKEINSRISTETTKNKIQEKHDNIDELHKIILNLQKENFIKGKLLNESYIKIKNKFDKINDLRENINNIELLKTIRHEINNQLTDMNDFIKLDKRMIKLDTKDMNIVSTIESLLDNFHTKNKNKELDIFYYINPSTPDSIIIDSIYFSKILEKLLVYSLNTTTKGYIFISITAEKKSTNTIDIKFLIENTSSGVEDNKLIWGDTAIHNNDYIISDLGLILCKKWSDILGGKIWLESKIGKGTSFFVTFELPTNKVIYKPKEELAKLKNKNIVLVETKDYTTRLFKLYVDRYESNLSVVKNLSVVFDSNIDLLIINNVSENNILEELKKYLMDNNFPILIICSTKNNNFINRIEAIDNFYDYKNNNLFFLTTDYIKEGILLNTLLSIFNSYVKGVHNIIKPSSTTNESKNGDFFAEYAIPKEPAQNITVVNETINTENELIDFNVISNLKEISDESNNLFNEIVSDFEEEIPTLIKNLKIYIKHHDKKLSLELIKKIKEPSINLGTKKLFKSCEVLQDIIKKEEFKKADAIVLQIEEIYLLSIKELQTLLI